MKRGEIWWADLPTPIGRRPVLLLSRDEAYSVRNAAMVAELTTKVRRIPVEVPVGKEDGLRKSGVVNLDTIQTIRKELLLERAGVLSAEKMADVGKAIRFALDL